MQARGAQAAVSTISDAARRAAANCRPELFSAGSPGASLSLPTSFRSEVAAKTPPCSTCNPLQQMRWGSWRASSLAIQGDSSLQVNRTKVAAGQFDDVAPAQVRVTRPCELQIMLARQNLEDSHVSCADQAG